MHNYYNKGICRAGMVEDWELRVEVQGSSLKPSSLLQHVPNQDKTVNLWDWGMKIDTVTLHFTAMYTLMLTKNKICFQDWKIASWQSFKR